MRRKPGNDRGVQHLVEKIHIAFEFRESSWGGGNQFLSALRDELIARNLYAEDIQSAAIVLFNSYHLGQWRVLRSIITEKAKRPSLTVVHRVDGPFSLVRGSESKADLAVRDLNWGLADATIFQSNWSRVHCQSRGVGIRGLNTTIVNAAGSNFSDHTPKPISRVGRKIRIASSGWSTNANKGFADLLWLDQNLDFSLFDFVYYGNSPTSFENIRLVPPLTSAALAKELRKSDIFFSGARNEPCSNSLIEGLASGLPAVAFNGGGNPEIIGNGGLLYDQISQVPAYFEEIVQDLEGFRSRIEVRNISRVADEYLEFFRSLLYREPTTSPITPLIGLRFKYGSQVGDHLRILSQKIREKLAV